MSLIRDNRRLHKKLCENLEYIRKNSDFDVEGVEAIHFHMRLNPDILDTLTELLLICEKNDDLNLPKTISSEAYIQAYIEFTWLYLLKISYLCLDHHAHDLFKKISDLPGESNRTFKKGAFLYGVLRTQDKKFLYLIDPFLTCPHDGLRYDAKHVFDDLSAL